MYVPAKSKPMLPSLASIREEKAPPTRKSTSDFVVCQSSDAAFHCLVLLRHKCRSSPVIPAVFILDGALPFPPRVVAGPVVAGSIRFYIVTISACVLGRLGFAEQTA